MRVPNQYKNIPNCQVCDFAAGVFHHMVLDISVCQTCLQLIYDSAKEPPADVPAETAYTEPGVKNETSIATIEV